MLAIATQNPNRKSFKQTVNWSNIIECFEYKSANVILIFIVFVTSDDSCEAAALSRIFTRVFSAHTRAQSILLYERSVYTSRPTK